MQIRIKNLLLRTIIGVREWEREEPRDIVLNLEVAFDGSRVATSDRLEDTIDYSALTDRISTAVRASRFFLIERLAHHVLEIVMEDERVRWAQVEVDKPHALRFSESVSAVVTGERAP